jgi:hypothetical protein
MIRFDPADKACRRQAPERDLFVQRLLPAVRHRSDRLDVIAAVMLAWRSETDHIEAQRMLSALQLESQQAGMRSGTLRRRP